MLTTQVAGPITAADAARRARLTEAGARRALLTALLRGELDRYQALLTALKEAVKDLPDLRLAWIEGFPTDPGDPLHIGMLAAPASIDWLGQEVRRRITSIEEEFELTIEIHALTRAEMPEREWTSTVVLRGLAPTVEPEDSSRAERLRQSSPFFAVLTPEERDEIGASPCKNRPLALPPRRPRSVGGCA